MHQCLGSREPPSWYSLRQALFEADHRDLAIAYGSESQTKTSKDGRICVETLIWTDTWLKRNGRWQIIAAEDLIPAG